MARKDKSWVRAVVCEVVGPMCPPTSSGGTTRPDQRWMDCRSRASLQSEAQIRSVSSRIPRSTRAPPVEQLSISTPGCAFLSSSSRRAVFLVLSDAGEGSWTRRYRVWLPG
jgi:hypothetical protein